MKGIILLCFLAFCSVVSATTYYVAPTTATPAGNDSNKGTKDKPWATWGKAFNWEAINPGDTIYFRGGVYMKNGLVGDDDWYYPTRPAGSDGYGYAITRDGTITDTLCYFAYPPDYAAGNLPILDCGNTVPSGTSNHGIRCIGVHYVKFKGLTIRNVWQVKSGVEARGWNIGAYNTVFENCTIYNIGGNGFRIEGSDECTFLNCDAYSCCDFLPGCCGPGYQGGQGTGFRTLGAGTTSHLYFIRCRAWKCSDQGFSCGDEILTFDGCWASHNGFYGLAAGDGHGFKLGWVDYTSSAARRIVHNCIAAYNEAWGFDTNDNGYPIVCHSNINNNTSYHNGWEGFCIFNTTGSDAEELSRVYKNNIAYANTRNNIYIGINALYTHSNNSWDIPLTITDADFVSLGGTVEENIALLSSARQSDGSLPDLNGFLRLKSTSKAINAGINVGLPYNGKAPDLGAWEYDSLPGSNKNPTVTITSPYNGNTFTAPAIITITVNASDSDGSISKVEFFNGTVKLGEKTAGLWSFTWNNVPEGTYSLTAVATDDLNAKTTSSAVSITVNSPTPVINQPLVITIINPVAGSTYTAPANIGITANLSDPDGTVTKVEFFNGATKLGEKTSSPWSFAWNNVADGNYSLTAVATDNLNATTTSFAVSITVNDLPSFINQPPVVSIVNPSKGQKYQRYKNITMEAVASDPDGTISKVEFYNGNIKLAEIATAPYSYTWEYVDEGTYSITARAIDNLNAVTVSSSVWVEVEPESLSLNDFNPEIFNLYPNPNDGHFSIVLIEPVQNENRSITIITFDGKTIYNEPLLQEEITKQFDLSYFKPGTYILIIAGKTIIATKKFIKD